jgi:hypothetical protein
MTATQNIQFVINAPCDLRPVWPAFEEAYKTGALSEDFADLFSIEILKGYNPDGSDRMVVNAA